MPVRSSTPPKAGELGEDGQQDVLDEGEFGQDPPLKTVAGEEGYPGLQRLRSGRPEGQGVWAVDQEVERPRTTTIEAAEQGRERGRRGRSRRDP